VTQRSEQADRVLDLAREEADLLGHRYLGPEHLVLGVLRDGGSGASQILEANGVNLSPLGRSYVAWPSGGWCRVRGPATPSC
jgi:ATP-dependent Clp protease ATP-binding subunit ClpC